MNKLMQKFAIFTSALLLTTTTTGSFYNADASSYTNLHNEIYSQELVTDNNIENEYYNISANIENIVALPDTIKTGVVTSNGTLNMRKGAGTRYAVIQKLKKGETVTILDSKSGWYKVKSSKGKTGWVSSKYIKVSVLTSTATNALPDTNIITSKIGTVNSNSALNMRKGAGTKYAVIQKLKKGETVTILDSKSGWYKVKSSKGKTGWVSSKYIKINSIKNASNSTSNTTTSKATVIISTSNKTATSNVVVSNNNSTSNTNTNTSTSSEKNTIINNILTTEGKVTSAEKTAIKENLNKLPLNLLKAVQDSGLKVLLTTKDVKTYYNYSFSGTMTGLFDPMAGKIYISSNVTHINKSTVHEFGHALDLLIGKSNYISLSKEWNNIYKAELNTASGSYYKANAQEYFADSFNRYIENPSALKTSAPKTYAYINSAIKNL